MAKPLMAGTREIAKGLYLEGKSLSYIGQITNTKTDTIRKWAIRGGWTEIRLAVTKVVQNVMSSKVNQALAEQGDKTRLALATEIQSAANAFAKAPCVTVDELLSNEGRQSRVSGVKTLVEAASAVFGWSKDGGANGLSSLRRFDDAIDVTPCESTEAALGEPSRGLDVVKPDS